MSARIDPYEVEQWLERLLSGESEQERIQAASELGWLHQRVRGTVRSRGNLERAALPEFPASMPDITANILTILQQEQSPAVRREVVATLGEWGGAETVETLSEMIDRDPDEGVRRACASALGLIGGSEAVQALRRAAVEQKQPETVWREAINALAELALKGPKPRITTLGTQGGRSTASEVAATLQQISTDKGVKGYLRNMAEAGLKALTEPD